MKGSEIANLVIMKLEEKSAFLNPNSSSGSPLSGAYSLDEVKPIYSYIDEQLPSAANEILVSAPLNRLVPKSFTQMKADYVGGTSNTMSLTSIRDSKIYLPPDFLRLHTLKVNEWARPVHSAITSDNPLYQLQFSPYTKGTPQKPVVFFSGIVDDYSRYGIDMLSLRAFSGQYGAHDTDLKDSMLGDQSLKSVNGIKKAFVIFGSGNMCYCESNTAAIIKKEDLNTPYLELFSVVTENPKLETLLYIPAFTTNGAYNIDIAEAIALNCAKKVMEVFGNVEGVNIMQSELTSVLGNLRL